jgi:nucleotide-binding universal stress UspA family protein
MKPIRRILVATDFSASAERALDYAVDIARAFDGSITLLHAWDVPVYGLPDGLGTSAEMVDGVKKAGADALRVTSERRKGCGVPIALELRADSAWCAINDAADAMNADLVVLGTHGRRGLSHALLGSVAEKVVRTSLRPVLTIPAAKAT